MRIILLTVTASLMSGCAVAPEVSQGPDPKLQAALAGKTAQAPKNCIAIEDARGGEFFRDAIVYRQSRTRLLLAETEGCPDNQNDHYITVLRPFGSQICRGDQIQLIDRSAGFWVGSCRFGKFTEHRAPKG